ncbi:MAG: hypothetical protein CVU29_07520 [Betaproteobacteria bacterium HGW-Betaproteobacteria-22]|nr:MAG: hypothetical protein CVU29_07520 [Betaproteobacteria bacterium HGW-Betaproteobacteria-22]
MKRTRRGQGFGIYALNRKSHHYQPSAALTQTGGESALFHHGFATLEPYPGLLQPRKSTQCFSAG